MSRKAELEALVRAAREYLETNPAFRLRPVGGADSIARLRQEDAIAAEDTLRAALVPFKDKL